MPITLSGSSSTDAAGRRLVFSSVDAGTSFHPNQISTFAREELALIDARIGSHGTSGRIPSPSWPANAYDVTMNIVPNTNLLTSQADWTYGMVQFAYRDLVRQNIKAQQRHTYLVESTFKVLAANNVVVATGSLLRSTLGAVSNRTIITRSSSAAGPAAVSQFNFSTLPIPSGSYLDQGRTVASLQAFLARVNIEISAHCPSCPIPRNAWIVDDDYLELESYANAVDPPLPEDWTWQTLQYIVLAWLNWASKTGAQPESLQESYFFVDKAGESTRVLHVVSGSLKRAHPGSPSRPPAAPDAAAARLVLAGRERDATTNLSFIRSRSLETFKRATVATNATALTAPNVSDLNLGLYLDPVQAARDISQSSIISLVENILKDIGRAADASQSLPNPSYSQSSGLLQLTLHSQGLERQYWNYGVLEWFGSQLLKQGGNTDPLLESSVRILDVSSRVYPYPGRLVVSGSLALTSAVATNATTSTAMETAKTLDYSVLLTPVRNALRIPRSLLLDLVEKILNTVERSPGLPQPLSGSSYHAKSDLLELNLVRATTRGEAWTYGMLEYVCGALLEQDQKRGFLQESKLDLVTSVLVAIGSLTLTSHQTLGGTSSPVNDPSDPTAPLHLASEKRATPITANTTALNALNVSAPNLRLELTDRFQPENIPRLAFRFLARQIFEELAEIPDLSIPIPRDTWQDDTEYIYLTLVKASQGAEEFWTYEVVNFVIEFLLAMSEVGPRLRESELKVLNMDEGTPGRTVATGSLLLYPRLQGISSPGNDQNATARVDVTSRSMETVKRSPSYDPGGTGGGPISGSAQDGHQDLTILPHPNPLTIQERATLSTRFSLSDNITIPKGLNLRGELTPIRDPFTIPRLAFQALIGQIVNDIEIIPDWQPLFTNYWRDDTVLMSLSLSRVEGGGNEDWTYGMLRWVLVWLIRREMTIGLRESRLKVLDMNSAYPGRLVATGALFMASSKTLRPGNDSTDIASNGVQARSSQATVKRATNPADTTASVALSDTFLDFRLELTFLPGQVTIPRLALQYLVAHVVHDTRHTTNASECIPGNSYHAETNRMTLRVHRVEANEAEWTYGFLDWLCETLLQRDEQEGPLPVGAFQVRDVAGGGRGRFIASGLLLLSMVTDNNDQNDTAKVDITSRSLKRATIASDTTAIAALNDPKLEFRLDLKVSHGGIIISKNLLPHLVTLILGDIQSTSATQSISEDSYRFNSGLLTLTLRRDGDGAGNWTYGMLEWVCSDLLEKNERYGPLKTSNIEVLTMEGKPVADGVLLLSRYEGGGVSLPDSDQNATTRVDVTSRSLDTTNISALAPAISNPSNIERTFRLSPLHAALTIPHPVLVDLVMKMLNFIEHGPGPDASLPEATYSVDCGNLDLFLRRVGSGGGDWTYGMLMYVSEQLLASVTATVKESTVQIYQVIAGQRSVTAAGVLLLRDPRGGGVGDQIVSSSATESNSTTAASASALPVAVTIKKRTSTLPQTKISAVAAANGTITTDPSNVLRSLLLTRLRFGQFIPHSALLALIEQIVVFIERAPSPNTRLPSYSFNGDSDLLGFTLLSQGSLGTGPDWTYGMLAYVCGELLLASGTQRGLGESLFMVYDGVGPGAVFVATGLLVSKSRDQHANPTNVAMTMRNTTTARNALVAAPLPRAASTINRNIIFTQLRDPHLIPHPALLDLVGKIVDFIGLNYSTTPLPDLSYNWNTDGVELILFKQGPGTETRDWTYGMLAYVCYQLYWVTMSPQGAYETLVQVLDVVGQGRSNVPVAAGALMLNYGDVSAGNTTTINTTFMNSSSSSSGDNLTTTALAAAAAGLPQNTSTINRQYAFTPLRNPLAISGQDLRNLLDQIFYFIGPNLVDVPLPEPSYIWKTDQVELVLFREGPSAVGSDDWTYGMLTYLCFHLYWRSSDPDGVAESYVQAFDVVGDGRPNVLVAFGVLIANSGNGSAADAAAGTTYTNTTGTTFMDSSSFSSSSAGDNTTSPAAHPYPYLLELLALPGSSFPLPIPLDALLSLIEKILDDITHAGGNPSTPLPNPNSYTATAESVELTLSPLQERGEDWDLGMLTFVSARLLEVSTGMGTRTREATVRVLKDNGAGGGGERVWERVVQGQLVMESREGEGGAGRDEDGGVATA